MSGTRKPSLFALKMQKLRETENSLKQPEGTQPTSQEPNASSSREKNQISTMDIRTNTPLVQKSSQSNIPMDTDDNRPPIPDYAEIHEENTRKLSNMSKEEIQKLRNEVLQTLKPAQVEFLRKKRKASTDTGLESKFEKLATEKALDANLEDLQNAGVHMDVVEPEKLKWMEDVPKIPHPLPKSFNARFDFDGSLLPYVEPDKSTCDKGLYNHGDEPHRPGYSIEELYQLTRSSVTGQRVFALNTLAAVLEKEYILADHLETPLLKQLIDSGIFLILRFSLDERVQPVYLAALRAIDALLWRPLDMHYLSDMVGVFGDLKLPTFEIFEKELTKENMEELTDTEMLKLDLIKGALRTEIVQRFRYILEAPIPEAESLLSIVKCLTRISYHSHEATLTIMKTRSLLETLFEKCRSPAYSDKLSVAKLMILLRVIACRSKSFALQLNERLNIIPFVLSVIGDPTTKTSTSGQCIYLWNVLLRHGIGHERVSEFVQLFVSLLNQLHRINVDNLKGSEIVYATSLITLLIFLFDRFYETVRFLIPILESLCCQWINIFTLETRVSREFSKLVCNSIYLLNEIQVKNSLSLARFNVQMKVLTNVNIYDKLTKDLRKCSFVLNTSKEGFVECLPSLCIPVSSLNSNNNLLVVHSIVKYGLRNGCHAFVRGIFNDELWRYVDSVLRHPNLGECCERWSARYEIRFLCDLLKLCSTWEVFEERRLVQLAFALVRVIAADEAYLVGDLFSEVIFNAKIYEQWMTEDRYVTDTLSDLENMKNYFFRELNVSRRVSGQLMGTERGAESLLSTDWHYVPILKISNAKNLAHAKAPAAETIRSALRWIYLMEYFAHEIETGVSLASRYCRVACVFFCGDVFLEVDELLHAILNRLLSRNEELEFDAAIPGISSFYDFYSELCEQFVSSSYCNPVFGMYVLVPLQQRYELRLRKYVWMEQPVMLRFLTVKAEQLPIPFSCFLSPCETDVQLVEVYLRHLAVGNVKQSTNPICYTIGLHHIATMARTRKDDPQIRRLLEKIDKIGNQNLRTQIETYQADETNPAE